MTDWLPERVCSRGWANNGYHCLHDAAPQILEYHYISAIMMSICTISILSLIHHLVRLRIRQTTILPSSPTMSTDAAISGVKPMRLVLGKHRTANTPSGFLPCFLTGQGFHPAHNDRFPFSPTTERLAFRPPHLLLNKCSLRT